MSLDFTQLIGLQYLLLVVVTSPCDTFSHTTAASPPPLLALGCHRSRVHVTSLSPKTMTYRVSATQLSVTTPRLFGTLTTVFAALR
ncbi:hypothetical protein J6590_047653 [Homalodisca vitripennis]|nr:hypothetical protein J6590_047653 [Homalodisca vitripennis]